MSSTPFSLVTDMLYIGIDLGTSAVKLLLVEENGTVCRSVSRSYPISYPRPGWSEQGPEDWYRETLAGLHELLQGCDKQAVKGLGIGGQMHGLVILDEKDQVIRPAILWNDGRSKKQVDYLNKNRDQISHYTANIAYAGFTAPKLLWLAEKEPELFSKVRKILLPKDYLVYRLTGEFVTDPSDASGTLYYDVKNKHWSKPMLDMLDIQEEMLPTVHESYEKIGYLRDEIAKDLGLDRITVATGAGDNAAAAVGTGTVGPGACNISLGTSGTVFLSDTQFHLPPANSLHSFAHADGGYHLMGCMLSAASCGKWWIEDILKTEDYSAEQQFEYPGSVYFLPYLMGERSPHNDVNARGVFFGLGMDTTRQEMTHAIYEGVTFGLRDCMEIARSMGISPKQATLCGGGARSPMWRQLCADILELPIVIPKVEEGPAYGAAILSMVAQGAYPNVAEAAMALTHTKETIFPQKDKVQMYQDRYDFWRQLYPSIKPLFSAAQATGRAD